MQKLVLSVVTVGCLFVSEILQAGSLGSCSQDGILRSTSAPKIDWAGKRVLWLGTSIPHQGVGVDGYPELLCEKLGCEMVNNAFSGSHIRWFETGADESCATGRNTPKGLSATTRELTNKIQSALPDDGLDSYDESCDKATSPITMGYEYRINRPWKLKPFDVVIIDHGHNDRIHNPVDRAGARQSLENTYAGQSIIQGKQTKLSYSGKVALKEGDDITIRIPGVLPMDYWTGEVASASGATITIDLDSSSFVLPKKQAAQIVKYDKTNILDAYDLIISDIYHMGLLYSRKLPTVILMSPPSVWSGGSDDGAIEDVSQSVCQVAQKWTVPFYYMSGDLGINEQNLQEYLPDKVHPTTHSSREYIANHIYNWLMR